MPVYFHVEIPEFTFRNKKAIEKWIRNICYEEGNTCGTINIVAISDNGLLEMNKKYLGRDYYTDILAFGSEMDNRLNGDLYISVDRIKENAKIFNVTIENEIHRVIVHGILHLLGYQDTDQESKKEMKNKEEYFLNALHIKL